MGLLSRKQIVEKSQGYAVERVPVPEWGGDVLVRELTVPEVTSIGIGAVDEKTGEIKTEAVGLDAIVEVLPQIVSWTVIDASNTPLLTLEDVKAMKGKDFPIVQRLALKALELTGLVEDIPDPNA